MVSLAIRPGTQQNKFQLGNICHLTFYLIKASCNFLSQLVCGYASDEPVVGYLRCYKVTQAALPGSTNLIMISEFNKACLSRKYILYYSRSSGARSFSGSSPLSCPHIQTMSFRSLAIPPQYGPVMLVGGSHRSIFHQPYGPWKGLASKKIG